MKILTGILLIPVLGLVSLPAVADHDDGKYRRGYGGHHVEHSYDRFERRLDRQHARIAHGIESGELTRKEARRLRTQHRDIARLARKFNRNGYLNRYERRTLERELDLASQRIYRLKHNDRDRARIYGAHGQHDRHEKRYRLDPHGELHSRRKSSDDSGWSVVLSLLGNA